MLLTWANSEHAQLNYTQLIKLRTFNNLNKFHLRKQSCVAHHQV